MCRVTIWIPRLAPSVPEVEETSNPGHWFQISKGLLILTAKTLGQSRSLIAKGFNRTAREFLPSSLYKGLIWPFPSFSGIFFTPNFRANQVLPFSHSDPSKSPKLFLVSHHLQPLPLYCTPSTELHRFSSLLVRLSPWWCLDFLSRPFIFVCCTSFSAKKR